VSPIGKKCAASRYCQDDESQAYRTENIIKYTIDIAIGYYITSFKNAQFIKCSKV